MLGLLDIKKHEVRLIGAELPVGYGRLRKGEPVLSLVEAAYLNYRTRLEVLMRDNDEKKLSFEEVFKLFATLSESFTRNYVVYSDLRKRGYSPSAHRNVLHLYKRGSHAGNEESNAIVYVVEEREHIVLEELFRYTQQASGVRRRLILAVVDGESDITYYELSITSPKGSLKMPISDMLEVEGSLATATLLGEGGIVWDEQISHNLHSRGFFGTMLDERHLFLSRIELAYLKEKDVLEVRGLDGEMVSVDNILSSEADGEISPSPKVSLFERFRVYSDLREKGLVPKTGYKFGSHFRVYSDPQDVTSPIHSDYLLNVCGSTERIPLPELARAVRLCHSVRKRMLFALHGADIKYLNVEWVRL